MVNINEVVKQLELFSEDIIEFNKEATEADLLAFENKMKVSLPNDYRTFLQIYNGLSLMGVIIYGVGDSKPLSLEKVFDIEHSEVGNPMPSYLIPFSPDGMGNHYCFNMQSCSAESCQVLFWQHDYGYSETDLPEVTNNSFADWVQEVVIDWTLKDYDYNGNKK
jgi:cell wall assembly regulator SMI1